MIDFARARRTMVDNQLRTSAITNWRILDVMNRVPRELFVPEERKTLAYIDENVKLSASRTMLSPASLARLIQLAEVGSDDTVLDVGCGTGYSTAVLAGLAHKVVGLDDDPALADKARETLSHLGIENANVVCCSLEDGVKEHGPYDVVLIEGSVERVPESLLNQLADGGRLIAVVGHGNAAVAHVFIKSGREISSRQAFNASVPPVASFAAAPQFQF